MNTKKARELAKSFCSRLDAIPHDKQFNHITRDIMRWVDQPDYAEARQVRYLALERNEEWHNYFRANKSVHPDHYWHEACRAVVDAIYFTYFSEQEAPRNSEAQRAKDIASAQAKFDFASRLIARIETAKSGC